MTTQQPQWQETLVQLLALASRLEDEGQYNVAKLARAAADALGRRAGWQLVQSGGSEDLASQAEQAAAALASLGGDAGLTVALQAGAAALARGQVPLIDEAPHPFVCRTCGHAMLHQPAAPCPTCGAWPDTFQRFMPNYWFDALEPPAVLATLRQTPGEVAARLAGLSEDAVNRPPADGGWTMRNVLIHLRDAQRVFAHRVDLFLAEEHPQLEMKAVWTWAANEEKSPPTSAEIFEAYRASRAETLGKLEQMPLAWWWRSGLHQEFGQVTLRQQASYFAAHERTHLPQMARLRPG